MSYLHVIGRPSSLYDTTSPDWAPSLLLGHDSAPEAKLSSERYERSVRREVKRRRLELAETTQLNASYFTVLLHSLCYCIILGKA